VFLKLISYFRITRHDVDSMFKPVLIVIFFEQSFPGEIQELGRIEFIDASETIPHDIVSLAIGVVLLLCPGDSPPDCLVIPFHIIDRALVHAPLLPIYLDPLNEVLDYVCHDYLGLSD
jgi:hypothetical protein